jgi:chromosome partitioning protein
VSESSESLSERSKAIFERLRALDEAKAQRQQHADAAPAVPPPVEPPESVPGTPPSADDPSQEVDRPATPAPPAAPPPDAGTDATGTDPAERELPAVPAPPAGEEGDEAPPADDENAVADAAPADGAPADGFVLPGAADLPALGADESSGTSDEELVAPAVEAEPPASEGPAASPFARPLPRILAIANQKGGVGKTTTAVNLGACLADIGYRVLVVDLDPQGNASTGLGINIRDLQGSMYDVILHDLPIEDSVEATAVRNLFVAPSSLDLAGAEIELVPAFSRELRLKRALEDVRDDYDFVLIDCPPSLGLLTVNGLAAATEVVVPIQCEYYALEGLGQLLRNVNLVQKNLNPALELSAIVLVMHDARTKLADQVVREVRTHFGDKVCRNVVPRTVRLSEAPSFGQPIIAFDPSSRGAVAYRELAKEVSGGAPQRLG